jgi:nucleoporin NDC1
VFVYYLTPIRGLVWNISFNILRWIHHIPSKQKSQKTGIAPAVDLIARLITETFLLNFLWDFANTAFSAYISQEPLKKGKPLTEDGKDPNGSLIVGLKAKKEFAKATAFWELVLITTRFPARRQTIYSELDRAGGSTWSQIKTICLDEISAVKSRIVAFQLASAPPAPVSDADIPSRQPIAAPLKTDNVFAPAPAPATEGQKVAAYARSVALRHGMSPGAKPLQNALEYSGRKLLTDGQRAQIQPDIVKKKAEGWFVQLVKSPVGWPFRQPFARRAMSVICGTPYSRAGVIIDAVDALTRLAVESLREDTYGKVSKDVAAIVRVFADTITAIEAFVAGLEPHWTDVEFSSRKRGSVKEINEILDTLRDGLGAILGAYGEYLGGLGMGDKELKAIKVLVAKRKEMEEIAKA